MQGKLVADYRACHDDKAVAAYTRARNEIATVNPAKDRLNPNQNLFSSARQVTTELTAAGDVPSPLGNVLTDKYYRDADYSVLDPSGKKLLP